MLLSYCYAELGSLLLKCNHCNYNYFGILAITIITITAFFNCNALHYNYLKNVVDNYISITSITLNTSFENLTKITTFRYFIDISYVCFIKLIFLCDFAIFIPTNYDLQDHPSFW